MNFKFSEEKEAFRQEVRNFPEDEIKNGICQPMCDGSIQGFSWDFTKKYRPKAGWVLPGRKSTAVLVKIK